MNLFPSKKVRLIQLKSITLSTFSSITIQGSKLLFFILVNKSEKTLYNIDNSSRSLSSPLSFGFKLDLWHISLATEGLIPKNFV